MEHVYFLESGVASMIAHAPSGLEIETGIVGKEGMVGSIALAGINQSPHEIFIQFAATARRVPMAEMRSLINGSPALSWPGHCQSPAPRSVSGLSARTHSRWRMCFLGRPRPTLQRTRYDVRLHCAAPFDLAGMALRSAGCFSP